MFLLIRLIQQYLFAICTKLCYNDDRKTGKRRKALRQNVPTTQCYT